MSIKLLRLYRTLRDLKIEQFIYRLKYLLLKPNIALSKKFEINPKFNKLFYGCVYKQLMDENFNFTLLNITKKYNPNQWQIKGSDKLWQYNLNYFDDLNSQDFDERSKLHDKLISDWIKYNPVGKGVAWESYPNSLRIVNWIKWLINRKNDDDEIKLSIIYQVRYLDSSLEYHLLANHLFTNAKALIFAGCYFLGTESEYWFKKGSSIIKKQIKEQILPDGGHFERSPMYHRIILVDLLDLINLLQIQGIMVPRYWVKAAEKMLNFMINFSHPDNDVPFFNDSTYGISHGFDEILRYANRLKIKSPEKFEVINFESSGFAKLSNENICLLFDVGSISPKYQPGHSHAGSLSIECSLFGIRYLVNSGISTYDINDVRFFQRSTKAHNTIEINNHNSSEVWSSFRVGKKANVECESPQINDFFLKASHDGYKDKKISRTVEIKSNLLKINDCIEGNSVETTSAYGRWYFGPDIKLIEINNKSMIYKFYIMSNGSKKSIQLELSGAKSAKIKPSKYYTGFNQSIDNKLLEYEFFDESCSSVDTKIKILG